MNPDLYILLQSLIVSALCVCVCVCVCAANDYLFTCCFSKLQISVENKKYDEIKVIQPLIWWVDLICIT